MKFKTRWRLALAAGLRPQWHDPGRAADRGDVSFNACAGCHGTNGGSAGPTMPSLASQSKEAIVDAMKKFKSGERPSTVMGRLAKGYTDAEFAAMGDFFSKQKLHADHADGRRRQGRQGCRACRKPTARAATWKTARKARTTRR